jgi:hypothetical protein
MDVIAAILIFFICRSAPLAMLFIPELAEGDAELLAGTGRGRQRLFTQENPQGRIGSRGAASTDVPISPMRRLRARWPLSCLHLISPDAVRFGAQRPRDQDGDFPWARD